jgi:hypothetical protein
MEVAGLVEESLPIDADTSDDGPPTQAAPMVAVYRHDVHKLRARPHASAADEYADVVVNETVPRGADQDGALLSRPRGDPDPTVANHRSPYRLSLLTGETATDTDRLPASAETDIHPLITPAAPDRLHVRWLTSDGAAAYNESVYYPYTSLQYHTLLTAALLDNYRAGHTFADLWLVATDPGTGSNADVETQTLANEPDAALAADGVEPHRTVLWTPAMALHVTGTPGDRPAARLGDAPAQSFADTWSRLSAHPIDTAGRRRWRLLDAQLRRIRSWSTALAYIDEFVAVHMTHDRGGQT